MKRIVFICLLALIGTSSAFAWGREGHEVIARIAENNLKPGVKKKIESYLGHSIVYYAKWMDEYRHTPEYKFTHSWHSCVVDEELKYVPQSGGDAVYGLTYATENLVDYRHLSDSAVAVNIKYLVHLVGDLHCPAHIKYRGREYSFKVKFGGGYIQPRVNARIHDVWDYYAIQSCRIFSSSEYAEELDRLSSREMKAIVEGTYVDWLHDNAGRCLLQFDLAYPDAALKQDFINAAMPLIETQMLYAGYRLAYVLNTIFK
jgi:hypothetical protein